MTLKIRLSLLSALAFLVVFTGRLNLVDADVLVYDNNAGGASGIDSFQVSDDDFPFVHADNFTLSSTHYVTSIQWTGAYIFQNTPSVDNFRILLFEDSGTGTPNSTPLATFNIGNSASRTDSGETLFGFQIYNYVATLTGAIQLTGGTTYWLAIANDTTGDVDDWFWGSELNSGDSAGRSNDGNAWSSTGHNMDFSIYAVPEPSGLVVALGISVMLFARQRYFR